MKSIFLPQLQVFSCYSLLESNIEINDLINHSLANEHQWSVLADWEKMHGVIDFYDVAKRKNLIPVFGLQFNWKNGQYLVLAKNQNGYANLTKISSKISMKEEIELSVFQNLIIILINGEISDGINDFYLANIEASNGVYIRESRFIAKEDYETYCALRAINNNSNLNDEIINNKHLINAFLNQPDFVSEDSILVKNLFKILKQIENFEPIKQTQVLQFPIVQNNIKINSDQYLESLAINGLKNNRFYQKNIPLIYQQRLRFELDTIIKMKFSDYFLIVQDFIREAKKRGIMVGPGRGSVAGSLVAYSIGITNVDPLEHNLYFERFLNSERQNLPDIDTDFMDTRRDEIVQYLYEKYDYKKVAQIITFQKIKARTAIRDIGRVLKIPLKKIDYISKQIPMDFTDDLINYAQNYLNLKSEYATFPKLFNLANKILNLPRQVGIHAAGLVLSNKSLGNDFPIMLHDNSYILTQYSMDYLERLGLIKIDILGLRNLTFIAEIIQNIKIDKNKIVIVENIPINDENIYNDLSEGNTIGIFQLESSGMTNLVRKFKPKCIEDLSLISALYRPGPQKHINHFLECRFKNKSIEVLHTSLAPILNETHGIIVYQEQLIEVVKIVTNFTAAKADIFRRVISKKEESKMNSLKEEFIKAGIVNNYNQNDLDKIWKYIYEFANYGFNHAHSIAYSYVSYWLAYLRHYYPMQFFTVLLSSSNKIAEYVYEAQKNKIICCPPNLNYSTEKFTNHEEKIYFSYKTISGFGDESIKNIIEAKKTFQKLKYDNYEEALKQLIKHKVTINQITILIQAGAFDDLVKDKNRYWLDTNIKELYNSYTNTDENEKPFFLPKIIEVEINDEIVEKYNDLQYQLIGVKFNKSAEKFKDVYDTNINLNNLKDFSDGMYLLPVIIQNFRQVKSKNNKMMVWTTLLDGHGVLESIPYFGKEVSELQDLFTSKKICVIKIIIQNNKLRIKEIAKGENNLWT